MDDRSVNEIEARLSALREAILERPTPGLGDARRRYDKTRRHPVQLAVFVTGVTVLVASLLVYGNHPGSKPTPAHPGPESALAQRIDKIAEQAAASAGDPKITEVIWVATSASAAATINGASMSGSVPIYLVEIPGSFVLKDSFSLTCAPKGSVEFLSIDRSSFEIIALGLRQKLDDLGNLGLVHVDRLRSGPLFPPTTESTANGSQAANCSSGSERAAFLALARKGADGTFSATYDVPEQLHSVATVLTEAHLAPVGSASPTSGSWMFEVDRINTGDRFLWVSHPDSTAVCTASGDSAWSCSQTSLTYPQGNGWFLATALYLPVSVLDQIEASGTSSTTSRQVVDGRSVECLTDSFAGNGPTVRWCITASGVLASFSATSETAFSFAPLDATVTSMSMSAPESLFTLPAHPGPWEGDLAPPDH